MVIASEEMEPKLASVMDAVPECEGLIYADINGEVVIGQTITEMDLASIAQTASVLAGSDIGKPTHKGGVKDITLELDKGFIIIALKGDAMLIGLLGVDGKNSVGLLTRQIKQLL
jgi:predicted regulator of Ras-like GTPase activity (Roadblock/LC7/MglB family)